VIVTGKITQRVLTRLKFRKDTLPITLVAPETKRW
ncbi:MAG: hypothetical protein ACI92C_002367, partial [Neolewinella sp.]